MPDPPITNAPGSTAALDVLTVCHDRIRAQMQTLKRLAAHVQVFGADALAQQAAANVIRYFDTAAAQHHADEERTLFPALRAAAIGDDAQTLEALLVMLVKEHRQMTAGWQRLRAVLSRIAEGHVADLDVEWVGAFEGLYDAHIQREERRLFPLATTLLNSNQLLAIGASIALRRTSGH